MGMDRWTNAWRWGFAATYKVSKEKKKQFYIQRFFHRDITSANHNKKDQNSQFRSNL